MKKGGRGRRGGFHIRPIRFVHFPRGVRERLLSLTCVFPLCNGEKAKFMRIFNKICHKNTVCIVIVDKWEIPRYNKKEERI